MRPRGHEICLVADVIRAHIRVSPVRATVSMLMTGCLGLGGVAPLATGWPFTSAPIPLLSRLPLLPLPPQLQRLRPPPGLKRSPAPFAAELASVAAEPRSLLRGPRRRLRRQLRRRRLSRATPWVERPSPPPPPLLRPRCRHFFSFFCFFFRPARAVVQGCGRGCGGCVGGGGCGGGGDSGGGGPRDYLTRT